MLVAGVGGYVGGRLVEALRSNGDEVLGITRDPVDRLDIDQIVCDLAAVDPEEIHSACEGVDAIVHLAGENEVVAASQPAAALSDTVVATEKLVEAATGAGVKRLVYMSTVHVYGARMEEGAVLTEELRPEPRSNYAIARLASEHLAAMLNASGTELVVFRLSNSVGAPDHPAVDRWSLVANDLCRQGATLGALELRSSGIQWRDFVPLRDVCSILVQSTGVDGSALPGGTYNLASGSPTTVRALAELVQEAFERHTGDRPELRAPDPEARRPEPYHVSVERLAGHGLTADTPLTDAIDETVRFCLDHRKEL